MSGPPVCRRCAGPLPVPKRMGRPRVFCSKPCKYAHYRDTPEYRAANRARMGDLYREKRAAGVCVFGFCGEAPVPGRQLCRKHLDMLNARTRAAKRKARAK